MNPRDYPEPPPRPIKPREHAKEAIKVLKEYLDNNVPPEMREWVEKSIHHALDCKYYRKKNG